jgi:hypothetical protein
MVQSLVARAKDHHESVNAAYASYYTGGRSSYISPRPSLDSQNSQKSSSSQTSTSGMSKAWQSVKKAAKEHHQSVNATYETYYCGGLRTTSTAGFLKSSMGGVRGEEEA